MGAWVQKFPGGEADFPKLSYAAAVALESRSRKTSIFQLLQIESGSFQARVIVPIAHKFSGGEADFPKLSYAAAVALEGRSRKTSIFQLLQIESGSFQARVIATGGFQLPWRESSIRKLFYGVGGGRDGGGDASRLKVTLEPSLRSSGAFLTSQTSLLYDIKGPIRLRCARGDAYASAFVSAHPYSHQTLRLIVPLLHSTRQHMSRSPSFHAHTSRQQNSLLHNICNHNTKRVQNTPTHPITDP
jgi:hypothetical protein